MRAGHGAWPWLVGAALLAGAAGSAWAQGDSEWPAPGEEPEERPRPRRVDPVPEDPLAPAGRRSWPAAPEPDEPLGAPLVWDDEPSFESHVRLSAFWMPLVRLVADRDYLEPDQGIQFHARLRTGSGWAGAFAIGGEHVGVGGFYVYSEHSDRRTGDTCRAHAAYVELSFEGALPPGGPLLVTLGGAIGLGGAVLDFRENTYDDAGGVSLEVRGWVGLRLLERVELTAGGGAFEWGVPGETIGYGAFATLGLTLRF